MLRGVWVPVEQNLEAVKHVVEGVTGAALSGLPAFRPVLLHHLCGLHGRHTLAVNADEREGLVDTDVIGYVPISKGALPDVRDSSRDHGVHRWHSCLLSFASVVIR